jgi:hypothetical protein
VAESALGNHVRVPRTTVKELEGRIAELEARHGELVAVCRRLAAYVEVLGVAVRSREAVPADDLDDAIEGLVDVHRELA